MKRIYYHLFFLFLFGCTGCEEEVEPCKDQYRTSADFIVEESLSDYWIECDTVNGEGNVTSVRFTAKFDADSFEWSIGRETINTKSFIRRAFPPGTRIPITLKVFRKNPSIKCFPDDKGVDSMTRNIYVWPRESYYDSKLERYVTTNPMPIQGKYRGYYQSNPSKQVDIVLKDTSIFCPDREFISMYHTNIPDGYSCPVLRDQKNCGLFASAWTKRPIAATCAPRAYRNYSLATFNEDSTIYIDKCRMQLSRNLKNIQIVISYVKGKGQKDSSEIKNDIFNGVKLY